MEFKGEGRRKDGKPFKDGNTREDGSYDVGKNRTPKATRFSEGDGRPRGRRPKGVKNFDTDWEQELNKTVDLKVNGKVKRMTAYRAQVKVTMDQGARGNIKAQEIIYERAERVATAKAERSVYTDDGIVEAWLAQRLANVREGIIGDDNSIPTSPSTDRIEGDDCRANEEPDGDQ